jgi:methylglutaconyl-CoA hydratase
MSEPSVLVSVDERGVATVSLNRPAVNNAYDGALIDQLGGGLQTLRADPRVRVLVLRGNGKHFQAGADLKFLARMAEGGHPNTVFSEATVAAMRALYEFPHPTVATVHGACFGGGVGFVASCDVAVAAEDAQFALTEVRWGIVPAPIVPQLVTSIGLRQTRRYALSGERFDAAEARRIGLVHEVAPAAELAAATSRIVDTFLASAPGATGETKRLALEIEGTACGDPLFHSLARLAADFRVTEEAKEGLAAFAEKRPPAWCR